MDSNKIGLFIHKLRIENNLTQQDLANKLFINRESVSKWERGINIPDTSSLIILSEIFNVSINEILYGERKNKENEKEVEKIPLVFINNLLTKIKKIYLFVFIIVLFFISIILIIYFVNNYNSIKLYTLDFENEKYHLERGVMFTTHDRYYLSIGNVVNINDEKNLNYKIIIEDINNEIIIFSSNDKEIYNVESNNNYLNNKKLKLYKNKIYIIINIDNTCEKYKLDIKMDYSNRFLLNNKIKEFFQKNNNEIADLSNINKFDITIDNENYECIRKNNQIIILYKDLIIKYNVEIQEMTIDKYEIAYNFKENICLSDDCNNYFLLMTKIRDELMRAL